MLVEWLILLLLVPAILVPLVLLGGFAGCSFEGLDPPLPPTDVRATWLSEADGVYQGLRQLTWSNPNTQPVRFDVEEWQEGVVQPQIISVNGTILTAGILEPDTTYRYRVRSVLTAYDERSDWSHPEGAGETIRTPFAAAYGGPFGPYPNRRHPGLQGCCIVQRIEPAGMRVAGGTRVRLILAAPEPLELTKITLSAAPDPDDPLDPYDAGTQPVVLAESVTLPGPETPYATPTINYPFDGTAPLLVAFEIGRVEGIAYFADAQQVHAKSYIKVGFPDAPVAEAETVDRSGYTLIEPAPGMSRCYLLAAIEVA